MTKVDEAALKKRARAMLIAMTDRAHWVYALPHEAFAGTCAFIRRDSPKPRLATKDGWCVTAKRRRVSSW